MKIYEIGGSVRDSLLGIESKDKDFVVIANSYEEMRTELINRGAAIFLERPEYFAIRCKLEPYGACDFVLGRCDGFYSDGRRPDSVTLVENLEQEVQRRDFTVNGLAKDENGEIIDYVNGIQDLDNKILRTIGKAEDRFSEDYLRLLRAMRFSIVKGFKLSNEIEDCLFEPKLLDGLNNISKERIYDELLKCFKFSTWKTLKFLDNYELLKKYLFMDERFSIWLKPTLEEK